MGMLYFKNIKHSHRLCLLSTIFLQFCSIKGYNNDGSFGFNDYSVLPFDTHLKDSLYGTKNDMFPEGSYEDILMGYAISYIQHMSK